MKSDEEARMAENAVPRFSLCRKMIYLRKMLDK